MSIGEPGLLRSEGPRGELRSSRLYKRNRNPEVVVVMNSRHQGA